MTSHCFSDYSLDQGIFKRVKWLGLKCPSSYSTLETSIASRILTHTGAAEREAWRKILRCAQSPLLSITSHVFKRSLKIFCMLVCRRQNSSVRRGIPYSFEWWQETEASDAWFESKQFFWQMHGFDSHMLVKAVRISRCSWSIWLQL